jgi:PAS domain S-box-containing protein
MHESLESALLFRDIAQNSPLSILITDARRKILFANPAALAMSGYSAEEVVGRQPRMFRSGLTPDETYNAMWAALGSGVSWSGELINRRKDGPGVSPSDFSISPIDDHDGTAALLLRDRRGFIATTRTRDSAGARDPQRCADRAAQPRRFCQRTGTTDAMPSRRPPRPLRASPWSISISMISRASIALSGTKRAIACWSSSAGGSPTACPKRTPSLVSATTSSACCLAFRRRTRATAMTNCRALLLAALRPAFVIGEQTFEVSSSLGFALLPCRRQGARRTAGGCRKRDASCPSAMAANSAARFDGQLNTEDSERRQLLVELRQVIEKRQLLLHYQPQLNLQTGALIGMEAFAPLAASGEGHDPARSIHSLGRRKRLDHRHRRMGARRGLPSDARMARRRGCRRSRWRSICRRGISALPTSARAFGEATGQVPDRSADARTVDHRRGDDARCRDFHAGPAKGSRVSAYGFRSTTSVPAIRRLPTSRVFPIDVVKIDQSFCSRYHQQSRPAPRSCRRSSPCRTKLGKIAACRRRRDRGTDALSASLRLRRDAGLFLLAPPCPRIRCLPCAAPASGSL